MATVQPLFVATCNYSSLLTICTIHYLGFPDTLLHTVCVLRSVHWLSGVIKNESKQELSDLKIYGFYTRRKFRENKGDPFGER